MVAGKTHLFTRCLQITQILDSLGFQPFFKCRVSETQLCCTSLWLWGCVGFIGLNEAQRLLLRGNLAFGEEISEEKQPLLSQSHQIYVPKLTIFKSQKGRISLSLWISLPCLLQSLGMLQIP